MGVSTDATPEERLNEALKSGKGPAVSRFILAVLTGATSAAGRVIGTQYGGASGGDAGELAGSMAGGAISGAASWSSERGQEEINKILNAWLKLQQDEINEIGVTITEVIARLDLEDERVSERIRSPEYLRLMKKCFRDWSAAESEEKRILIRNLLVNAAGEQVTTDSVVNLFVRWIDEYSEDHFRVVSAIYNHDGISRREIWLKVRPGVDLPREDSSEADLFKLLIRDLSMGSLVRQHREKDPYTGQFLPKSRRPSGSGKGFTSAFDDGEEYELTELGQQFVHYTMTEKVQKISAGV